MARLDEKNKEELRELTVDVLLAARREYLMTSGSNPLKQWDQIQDRMRAAARTCASPEEWSTSLLRSLQVSTPGKASSISLEALAKAVKRMSAAREWLDLLERECGYLIACARLSVEKKKREWEALNKEIDAMDATPNNKEQ